MKRILALALAGALLGGCTKSVGTGGSTAPNAAHRTRPAHELVIGDVQTIAGLNPHLVSAVSLGSLSELTMAYLARYGSDNR
ncbi:MAG: hypothetical protein JWO66_1304, partial [Candidatus Eremiobacteraeota bacterium]|nr:hypothetical protein [Candidatus Eremiobacteraeota bacterium]